MNVLGFVEVRANALMCPTAWPGASRKKKLPSPKKSMAFMLPIEMVEDSKNSSTTSRLAKASDLKGESLFSG
jgi:hypothetical protein